MAATGPVQRAVIAAARAAKIEPRDKATVELAKAYAADLDEGGDLNIIGPKLLAALDALLLSPKARSAALKGVTDVRPRTDPVDELRNRRAARQHDAAALDATAP